MSASEGPNYDAEREPDEGRVVGRLQQLPDGAPEVPLFLRDKSDGRKDDAQDEKDEVGE